MSNKPDGRFAMTPLAEGLRSDVPDSQRALAIMIGRGTLQGLGRAALQRADRQDGIRTTCTASRCSTICPSIPSRPPSSTRRWSACTAAKPRPWSTPTTSRRSARWPTSAAATAACCAACLQKYPKVRGMLCDLPGVLERAAPLIAAEGLAGRIQTIATNFFEAVPPGADAYIMRHIIHDWNDEQSLTILQNVRKVIRDDGRLLLVESVIPPGNEPSFGKLLDLTMMVLPGGKERTEAEYRTLLRPVRFPPGANRPHPGRRQRD